MTLDPDTLEAHIPRLRRYAVALVRDRTLADDLVQDTLERALRKFALFRRGSNLRAWLFTLMHNVYVNHLRSRDATQGAHPLDLEMAELGTPPTQDDALTARDIAHALEALQPEFREVVLLVGLEGLSYKETARVLDVPIGTVMSRLARGRERLRLAMDGGCEPRLRRVK